MPQSERAPFLGSADAQALVRLLRDAGVEEALSGRLAQYGALLLEANRRTNLTAARSPDALALHLLDSLSVVPHLNGPFADVGSGGGLPGIPAAIASGQPVTLVESAGKKAAFLRTALSTLNVPGVVLGERAETVGRDRCERERYVAATARAVASLPAALELTAPLLRIGGRAVLQRGVVEPPERTAAADAAVMLGMALEDDVAAVGERRILIYRKVSETPSRFPRRPGIPQKRPLCMRST